jgi:predicted transposase YdaD
MTYYLTATNPLVFTTQKAERVTESMIIEMLETLLRREYETYSPQEAKSNLQDVLQTDQVFREVVTPPEELTPQASQLWIQDLLESEAGQRLLNQLGAPLSKQEKSEMNLEEMTLSDLLPQLTIASEWDSEGPNLHSNLSSPQSSEA